MRRATHSEQNAQQNPAEPQDCSTPTSSNPSVSALKSPDQGIFFFASATKSAISATFSMWEQLTVSRTLSRIPQNRKIAQRQPHRKRGRNGRFRGRSEEKYPLIHCELLGAWLRLLKGETERANPSVSSPTRRARSGARFRSLCSRLIRRTFDHLVVCTHVCIAHSSRSSSRSTTSTRSTATRRSGWERAAPRT
jgi:hypothetical protein